MTEGQGLYDAGRNFRPRPKPLSSVSLGGIGLHALTQGQVILSRMVMSERDVVFIVMDFYWWMDMEIEVVRCVCIEVNSHMRPVIRSISSFNLRGL